MRATDEAALSISGVRIACVTSCPSIDTRPPSTHDLRPVREPGDRRFIVERNAVVQRLPPDRPVHRAGIDMAVVQRFRDRFWRSCPSLRPTGRRWR